MIATDAEKACYIQQESQTKGDVDVAERVSVELIDDLDGSPADEKILFGLEGSRWEIDLSKSNADKLREALQPFIEAGRPQQAAERRGPGRPPGGGGKSDGPAKKRQSNYDAESAGAARTYFQENRDKLPDGLTLPSRGRTPQGIIDAWKALGSPGL